MVAGFPKINVIVRNSSIYEWIPEAYYKSIRAANQHRSYY